MNSLDDSQKLHAEILREELAACRKLETWGASLFFGGIGLVAKQFVEWDQSAVTSQRLSLHPTAFAFPAVVGLVAFVFLRIVNYRGRDVSERLHALVHPTSHRAFGWLGWWLALLPMALGFVVSGYLAIGRPDRTSLLWLVFLIASAILVMAAVVHIRRLRSFATRTPSLSDQSRCHSSKGPTIESSERPPAPR